MKLVKDGAVVRRGGEPGRRSLFGPFVLSALLHLAVLFLVVQFSGLFPRPAEVVLERGTYAVELDLVSSVASRPSPAMVEPIEPEPVQEEPEETLDEPETQEPVEAPPVPAGIEQRQEVEERSEPLQEDLVTETPRTEESPVQPPESPAPLVKVREVAKPSPPQIPLETVETFSPPSRDPPPSEPEKRDPPRPSVESPAPESPQREGDRPEKGVTSPVVVQGLARPEYPRYSRIHGEEGRVLLSVVVHADGTPGNIEVIRSSGYGRLDRAAVRALQKATFLPAREAGRPVESTKRITFRFQLED